VSGLWVVAEEAWHRVSAARATVVFAGVFAALALAMSYFGLAGQRTAEFQGFARVSASLFNIVVYLVPLTALVLGTTEVTGRPDTMALVLAQPVRRAHVLLGSYLGVAGALAAALTIGLGGAGVAIAFQTSTASLGAYLVLYATSLGLLLSFLALAFFLGVMLLDRLRSMAAAVIVWFVTVIGYDLLLIGVSSVFRGVSLKTILLPAIMANPVDISRVLVTLASGRGALFGPAGATLVEVFGRPAGAAVACVALLLQITVPLAAAVFVFRRRDL
jgi:Cu-processing system permease protein